MFNNFAHLTIESLLSLMDVYTMYFYCFLFKYSIFRLDQQLVQKINIKTYFKKINVFFYN